MRVTTSSPSSSIAPVGMSATAEVRGWDIVKCQGKHSRVPPTPDFETVNTGPETLQNAQHVCGPHIILIIPSPSKWFQHDLDWKGQGVIWRRLGISVMNVLDQSAYFYYKGFKTLLPKVNRNKGDEHQDNTSSLKQLYKAAMQLKTVVLLPLTFKISRVCSGTTYFVVSVLKHYEPKLFYSLFKVRLFSVSLLLKCNKSYDHNNLTDKSLSSLREG